MFTYGQEFVFFTQRAGVHSSCHYSWSANVVVVVVKVVQAGV